jgi:hypothetical protein
MTCSPISPTAFPMKKLTFFAALIFLASSIGAQSPPPPEQKQIEVLIKAIKDQQTRIAENQALIDEKLATVVETVRVARIYSSRGGR